MKLVAILTLLMAVTIPLWAEENNDPIPNEEEIVKIRSGLCGTDNVEFAGSGQVFKKDGKLYVVTSEHVVLHGNERFCHSVENKKIGRIEHAPLLTADWGAGLALLKLPDDKGIAARDMSELFDIDPLKRNEGVILAGFRKKQDAVDQGNFNNLIYDDHGYVVLTDSDNHEIPLLDRAIEVMGAHGAYGNSGGPALRKSNQKLIGIISAQYIETVYKASPVRELNSDLAKEVNHLIIIPASFVKNWLLRYFKDPAAFRPAFVQNPSQQLFKKKVIFSQGVMFSEVPLNLKNLPPKAEKPGVGGEGVGGEGVGGEGVGGEGVGGEGVGGADAPKLPVMIVAERDPGNNLNLASVYPWAPVKDGERGQLFPKVVNELKLVKTNVEFRFFIKRTEKKRLKREYFYSLGEFFTNLRKENLRPMGLVPSQLGRQIEEKTRVAIAEVGAKLMERAHGVQEKSTNAEANVLLEEIQLFGEILTKDWELVGAGDAKRLQPPDEGESAEWRYLLSEQSDASIEILKNLIRAEEVLAKVKL